MSEFKNVLVATDFSVMADKAFSTAAALSAQLGATLHIVHIVQIHPTSMPESGNLNIDELEAKEEELAAENMKKYTDSLAADAKVTTSIVHGNPTSTVISQIKEKEADIVVMGTHGRTGLSRLIMGSVAESVMKAAGVPVVCVRTD